MTRPAAPATRRPVAHRVAQGLVGVFALACVVLWTYALWGPRHDPPGTLDEPGFAVSAERVCRDALSAIEALPLPFESTSPQERAEVVRAANAELEAMLDSLDTAVPRSGEDRRRVREWLGDWRTFLGDRQAYADALAAGEDPRFTETDKGGDHISQALEFFAQINDMPSCAPPPDVG